MAATGFATTRWSPGTMPTPTRTLHEARKSLEVGQHLSKILAPDQLLVRLHCAHTRWWPVIASPSQFSHRNPKACRWRPAVRFRWLIWSKKVCDVPEMAQGVSPLRVLNAVRLLVFCWRACPDMPKYHHVQGRHEKLWMWSVFNHNAQHWLKINCSRTLYWGKKTCSYRNSLKPIHWRCELPHHLFIRTAIAFVVPPNLSLLRNHKFLVVLNKAGCDDHHAAVGFSGCFRQQGFGKSTEVSSHTVRVSRLNPKSSTMFSKLWTLDWVRLPFPWMFRGISVNPLTILNYS